MARVKRLRVGVLFGGRSGEHEVSLASAAAVFANLDRDRYEPIAIRIDKDGRWVLPDRPPSAASAAEVIDQMRNDAGRMRGDAKFPAAAPGRSHAGPGGSPVSVGQAA
jgi:D-alanine-D-alanine ligase